MNQSLSIPVADLSQVGEARRNAAQFSSARFPNESHQSDLAIVVTEFATNLAKHAGGGEILISLYDHFIEVISIDRGPGITNVALSMQDGFSTAGTAGNGLGAIRRLSDCFDLYTQTNKGTIILARLNGETKDDTKNAGFEYSGLSVPIKGESLSGDAWALKYDSTSVTLLLSDGLGHGEKAHEASAQAIECFNRSVASEPSQLLQLIHGALRSSRGAAVSVLKIVFEKQIALFSGIGNVAGVQIAGGDSRRMISHNGIVGSQMRKVQEFSYPLPLSHNLLILHSDGVNTHWELSEYPGLLAKHPGIISAVIYRDHSRGRDDTSVATVKWNRS